MRIVGRSPTALLLVSLAAAAPLLAACGSRSPAASTTSTSAASTTSVSVSTGSTATTTLSPVASPSAITACNADALSVEAAVQTYRALDGSWPTSPSQLVGESRILRAWPNNSSYYSISLGADGAVEVTPAAGTAGHALGAQNYDTYEVPGADNICATI